MTFVPRFREGLSKSSASGTADHIRDWVTFTSVVFGAIAFLAAPKLGIGAAIVGVSFGLVSAGASLLGRKTASSDHSDDRRSGQDRRTQRATN